MPHDICSQISEYKSHLDRRTKRALRNAQRALEQQRWGLLGDEADEADGTFAVLPHLLNILLRVERRRGGGTYRSCFLCRYVLFAHWPNHVFFARSQGTRQDCQVTRDLSLNALRM